MREASDNQASGDADKGVSGCPLCEQEGGTLLFRDARLRVVDAAEADYPGWCRVIWNAHVKECSDLDPADQAYLLRAVLAVERAVRATMGADKVNLASLGNVVAHVHWHIVPRYVDDAHFPGSPWSARVRQVPANRLAERTARVAALHAAIVEELTSTSEA